MHENLDQKRARFAWERVQGQGEDYANLAKGVPALVMASGLMPVLAYLEDKGKDHHRALRTHLCEWLHEQFCSEMADSKFNTVMGALMGSANGNAATHARFYRQATEETMALLRWIRQFAAAVADGDGKTQRHA